MGVAEGVAMDALAELESVTAESGIEYQVEIQGFLDDPRENENFRVTASVDNGGWSSFSPLSRDFIVSPDGTFVDE